jgi:hypothetical protein
VTPSRAVLRCTHWLAASWRTRLRPFRTRRLLEVHLLVVAVCATVAMSTLFGSSHQIQKSAETVATREAPAVQGLAATRLAVLRADLEARALVDGGLDDVAGSDETYRAQLSAADQDLSRIADRTDQDLGTVNGLLASYNNSITLGTIMYRDQRLMQLHKLAEAISLLTRPGVGLAPRLDNLQKNQTDRAENTVTMGWLQRGCWWLAELALAALALTLLSALFVLRDRCGRDWNPYLLTAFALTVLLAVVPLVAARAAQHNLDRVGGDLKQITAASQRRWPDARLTGTQPADREKYDAVRRDLAAAQQTVTVTSERVRQRLTDGTWTDDMYQGTLFGGLPAAVLPVVGLALRLDKDYGRRR